MIMDNVSVQIGMLAERSLNVASAGLMGRLIGTFADFQHAFSAAIASSSAFPIAVTTALRVDDVQCSTHTLQGSGEVTALVGG
jgi:hypothetical protein